MKRPITTKRGKPKVDEHADGMSPQAWAKLRAKTDVQILAESRADPDALPAEDRKLGPGGRVALAKRIRWKLRLSQAEFAERFRIPLGTLRDWEQHRREPDQAARAYLEVIAGEPAAVIRALEKTRA